MKAKNAIQLIIENTTPEEELTTGWWDREFMNLSQEQKLSIEQWNAVAAEAEDMDWSNINERIDDIISSIQDT